MKPYAFPKSEKLTDLKIIEHLFKKDAFGFYMPPFRFRWVRVADEKSPTPCRVLFVVSKRNVKTATGRNRIKRQLRELYRLNKSILIRPLLEKNSRIALMISFSSKSELKYNEVASIFVAALQRLASYAEKNN